jgi:hypothetical protein
MLKLLSKQVLVPFNNISIFPLVLMGVLADMQKPAITQPLVAEIFPDCGRIKAEILLNLWKLSA